MMRRRELMGMQGVLKTVSGPIVTVNDALARNAKSLVVNFAPVQAAGTPAPDNVLPISGWTGVTGYRAGKNLFDKANANVVNGYITGGKIVASAEHKTVYIPCKPNTTYVCSNSANDRKYLSYADETPAAGVDVYLVNTSITTGANAKYLCVYCYNGNSDSCTFNDVLNALQIEVGSVASAYAPYSGATYPVTFPAVGKNKFDITQLPYHENPTTTGVWNTGNNTIKVIASASSGGTAAYKAGHFLTLSELAPNLEVGQTYFLSFTSTGSQKLIYLSVSADTWGRGTQRTITQNDLNSIVYFYASGTSTEATITDFQIEAGTTATAYEPYTNTIYGGYVDLVTGVLTVDKFIRQYTGSELTWNFNGSGSSIYFYIGTGVQLVSGECVCSHTVQTGLSVSNTTLGCNMATVLSNPSFLIRLGSSVTGSTVDSFKSWLAEQYTNGIPLQAVGTLATPITYQLTPQTIAMLRGTNNVWANTNGNIELTYYAQ